MSVRPSGRLTYRGRIGWVNSKVGNYTNNYVRSEFKLTWEFNVNSHIQGNRGARVLGSVKSRHNIRCHCWP